MTKTELQYQKEISELQNELNSAVNVCRASWIIGGLGWMLAIVFAMAFIGMILK